MEDFDMNKEYTHEDFDRMLIPLYDANDYPFMDQFEYMDAVVHNHSVERLREAYFGQKQKKGKNKSE